MKRIAFVSLLVLALSAFISTTVWAASAARSDDAKLVPTLVSLSPPDPYPGQLVQFTIRYQNEGTAAVPKDAAVGYRIEARAEGEAESLELKTGELSLEEAVQPGASGEVADTFRAPSEEGTYVLTAFLTLDGREESSTQKTMVVETALPPGVAQLFAGLGVFAAVMAIMAVGTEVVLEPIKSLLGMKQKVSAMEALDELKRELPGQLAGLGVDAKQVEEVQALFSDLERTLQPVGNIKQAAGAIQQGLFGDALKAIGEIENLPADATQDRLDELKDKAKSTAREGFAELCRNLHLSGKIATTIENLIETLLIPAIDSITLNDLQQAANTAGERLYDAVEQIQKALADPTWAKNWLNLQVDAVLTGSHQQVEDLLEDKVLPTLNGLGIPKRYVDKFEEGVKAKLDHARHFAQLKANTYTEAVRNLLMAVEKRRQEMQSPARKIWRYLRRSDQFSVWGALVGLLVAIAGVALPFLFLKGTWARVGIAIGGVVVGGLVAWLVSRLILRKRTEALRLGEAVTEVEKKCTSAIQGRESSFGKVDPERETRIKEMSPTSVASVTLELEDLHREEETNRIRTLRILSLIVGITLAFWLRIDAAAYLDYALPGIEMKINGLVDLHRAWSVLPEGLTVGIILTGLAASAGSKFWRDLLGRLQQTRGQAEEAARLVRKVKGTVGWE